MPRAGPSATLDRIGTPAGRPDPTEAAAHAGKTAVACDNPQVTAVLAGGLANVAVSLLTGLAFAWLYGLHRRGYLRAWAGAWLLTGLGLALSTSEMAFGPSWATAGFPTMLGMSGVLQLLAAYAFVERRLPRALLFVLVGLVGAGVLLPLAGVPRPESLLPSLIASVACLAGVGVVLLSTRRRSARVAAIGYLTLALHSLTFPLAAGQPDLLALGSLVAAMLQVAAFTGLLMMHYDSLTVRLEQSEARYRGLFDNALVGVFQAEPDGTILRANAALARMLGFASSGELELRGRMPDLLVDPDDWRRLSQESEDARIEGEELAFRTDSGAQVVAVVHARTTAAAPGQRRCEGVVQDVTEQRALLRERAEARRIETVGSLAGGVAHDFNNLLTVILSQLDLARIETNDAPEVAESLDAIQGAADQARRLTSQLLAYGRRQVLDPATLDLAEVMAEVAPILRRMLPENVELLVEPPERLCVVVDRSSFEQLLTNLVKNAGDALPRGGTVRVKLAEARRDDGVLDGPWTEVSLEVSDDGEGMDERTKERIFEPFFTTRQQGQGTGLGLATVKGIVAQLRGRVRVDSELGRGTTIGIVLRLRRGPASERPSGTHVSGERGGLRILVVEDQDLVRRAMVRLLKGDGHEVLEASHGEEALRVLGKQDPCDVIVSDVVMPVLGGLEMLEGLRERGSSIPVLLVTGHASCFESDRDLPVATRVLRKPFTHAQLSGALDELLESGHEREALAPPG